MTGTPPSAVAGKRATMLPQPAGRASPAASSVRSAPRARNSDRTASATAPSWRDGDGISHRRAMRRATGGSPSRLSGAAVTR